MRTPRIDLLLLGYYRLEFREDDIAEAADIFLKNRINIRFIGNSIFVSVFKFKDIERVLSGNIEYSVSELLGVCGILKQFVKRPVALITASLFVILFFLSSLLVWDVRIEGVEVDVEKEIRRELDLAGLKIGKPWFKIDKDDVETKLLLKSESVSWININRRGTVAYVSVIEKVNHDEQEERRGYANVVAERDCIIEEITVISGYATVKVGDTVRAGQILISGVYPSELGGGLCYAEGRVIGRYTDEISVSVPRYKEEKIPVCKKTCSLYINFFGFSLKLLKNYRNLPNDCVIIEDERYMTAFGGRRVPISLVRNFYIEYGISEKKISDEDMIREAGLMMKNELSDRLSARELLKIKTSAEFVGEEYVMTSNIVCTSDVGLPVEFDADISEK